MRVCACVCVCVAVCVGLSRSLSLSLALSVFVSLSLLTDSFIHPHSLLTRCTLFHRRTKVWHQHHSHPSHPVHGCGGIAHGLQHHVLRRPRPDGVHCGGGPRKAHSPGGVHKRQAPSTRRVGVRSHFEHSRPARRSHFALAHARRPRHARARRLVREPGPVWGAVPRHDAAQRVHAVCVHFRAHHVQGYARHHV